jgi:predicted nucleotidyltransferase
LRSRAVDLRGAELDLSPVRDLVSALVEKWHPLQIWLFGSRARGVADVESDWDLLAVVPDDSTEDLSPVARWRIRRNAAVRADVIVCRSHEFEEDRHVPNTLPYDATAAGVLIYER